MARRPSETAASDAAAPVPSGTLTEARSYPIVDPLGLSAGAWKLCKTADDAATFAASRPGKVVLKIQSPAIAHKTEAGGVALNLTAEQVPAAFDKITAAARSYNASAPIDGVLVQDMAAPGTEVIIGGVRDPSFGPVVMVGLGGILTEVLKDVAFASAPVGPEDATRMIDGLRGRKILDGARGKAPADKAALAEAIVAVSRIIAAPGVQEVDLNPVFVHENGLTVADALIIAEEAPT